MSVEVTIHFQPPVRARNKRKVVTQLTSSNSITRHIIARKQYSFEQLTLQVHC